MKVVFFDIDGTLIDVQNGLNKPSYKTEYAIKKLIENGNIVVIASGRFKGNIYKSIIDLNPSGFITSNGAYAEYLNNTIYEDPFNKDYLFDLMDFCKKYNCLFTAESQVLMYTPVIDDYVLSFMDKWLLPHDLLSDDFGDGKYFKCNIDIKDKKIAKLFEDTFKDRLDCRAQTANITGSTYDVNVLGVNKGNGVKMFLDKLNINKEDAICFCDGSNDIEMAMACKESYAMANGDDGLKAIASEVIDSALNDGVYKKLVQMGLISPLK